MPDMKYFEQFGPWAYLACIVIFAVGLAVWKVYGRMADTLDKRDDQIQLISKNHADAIERIGDKSLTCIDNNTKAITEFSGRLSNVEHDVEMIKRDKNA